MSSASSSSLVSTPPPVVLHGIWIAANPQRALFTVFLKDAPVQLKDIDYMGGEMKTKEYLSMNPLGTMPVLTEGNFKLSESRAISRFISQRYNTGINLEPDDDIYSRAICDQWLSVESTEISPLLQVLAFERIVKKFIYKQEPDEDACKKAAEKIVKAMDMLNNQLNGKKWILRDRITIVDAWMAPLMSKVVRLPEAYLVNDRPSIKAWWERISQHDAWNKVLEAGFSQHDAQKKVLEAGFPSGHKPADHT